MGRRGPAPAPVEMKIAKGETRPSKVNYNAPKLPVADASAKAPTGLAGAGKIEWDTQIGPLTEAGTLTTADLTAFGDYCRALTELRKFEAAAKRAGCELAIAKGYQGMVVKLRAQCNQLRQQLGLTPSSRSGVKAAKVAKPAGDNPMEKYLSALNGGRASA